MDIVKLSSNAERLKRHLGSLPEVFITDMTVTERRELLGLPALEGDNQSNEKLLIEKIGVGGATALITLLEKMGEGTLTETQVQNTIMILFGLSEDEAGRITEKGEVSTPPPVQPQKTGGLFSR